MRRRGYRLLLLETEGACKKAARRTIGAVAGVAVKDDSFRPHLVPLLRELLIEQPAQLSAAPAQPSAAPAQPSAAPATSATAATAATAAAAAAAVATTVAASFTAAAAPAAAAPAAAAAADAAEVKACVLRADAPKLAIVTDFGQQVSEAASGAELLSEAKVRGRKNALTTLTQPRCCGEPQPEPQRRDPIPQH